MVDTEVAEAPDSVHALMRNCALMLLSLSLLCEQFVASVNVATKIPADERTIAILLDNTKEPPFWASTTRHLTTVLEGSYHLAVNAKRSFEPALEKPRPSW